MLTGVESDLVWDQHRLIHGGSVGDGGWGSIPPLSAQEWLDDYWQWAHNIGVSSGAVTGRFSR